MWCLTPVVIHGKYYEFSNFQEALTCKLDSQQSGVLGTAQKTLSPTCGFV